MFADIAMEGLYVVPCMLSAEVILQFYVYYELLGLILTQINYPI